MTKSIEQMIKEAQGLKLTAIEAWDKKEIYVDTENGLLSGCTGFLFGMFAKDIFSGMGNNPEIAREIRREVLQVVGEITIVDLIGVDRSYEVNSQTGQVIPDDCNNSYIFI